MRLGAVELWVGERNKNNEFGLGHWTEVGRNLVDSWGWVLLTSGSGNEIESLNLGGVLGLQWEGTC